MARGGAPSPYAPLPSKRKVHRPSSRRGAKAASHLGRAAEANPIRALVVCDVRSLAPSLALFHSAARVRSAASSLLLSICGVLQAPLLFVLHGSKPASVCDFDSGPMIGATFVVVDTCTLGQYSLSYGAQYIHVIRFAGGTFRRFSLCLICFFPAPSSPSFLPFCFSRSKAAVGKIRIERDDAASRR